MASLFSVPRLFLVAFAAFALAACNGADRNSLRGFAPVPPYLVAKMNQIGSSKSAPVLVRVYKQEAELEIWKQTSGGSYALLQTYPICRWSGQLGPKKTEGDRQVPEGFYTVTPTAMNPNSRFYLSFDFGYPNAYDRSFGRTGGDIMVHGACSSRGCFSMTDEQMSEIYAVVRDAFAGGQSSFQAQSFPFRMTAENLAKHRRNPNIAFWKNLKTGSDNFEITRRPVETAACGGQYVFNGQGGAACGIQVSDPSVATAVASKAAKDDAAVAQLIANGVRAVAYIYDDGGIHPKLASRGSDGRPGQDHPYNPVRKPTVVVLDDGSGAPATGNDAQAASNATYEAAETLMAAEAALARRPFTPNPAKIKERQKQVFARIFGPKTPALSPSATVIAAAPLAAPDTPAADGTAVAALAPVAPSADASTAMAFSNVPLPPPSPLRTGVVTGDAPVTDPAPQQTVVAKSPDDSSLLPVSRLRKWFGFASGDAPSEPLQLLPPKPSASLLKTDSTAVALQQP